MPASRHENSKTLRCRPFGVYRAARGFCVRTKLAMGGMNRRRHAQPACAPHGMGAACLPCAGARWSVWESVRKRAAAIPVPGVPRKAGAGRRPWQVCMGATPLVGLSQAQSICPSGFWKASTQPYGYVKSGGGTRHRFLARLAPAKSAPTAVALRASQALRLRRLRAA